MPLALEREAIHMKKQTFLPAAKSDAEDVWALWRACAADPRSCWNEAYPTEAILHTDLLNGWLYILREDDRLIGSCTLMETDDLEKCGFPFSETEAIAVLTRLCVQPSLQGRGYGSQILTCTEAQALRKGAKAVHLLCDVRNTAALALYARGGYRRVCQAHLYGDHFFVHEKLLPSPG